VAKRTNPPKEKTEKVKEPAEKIAEGIRKGKEAIDRKAKGTSIGYKLCQVLGEIHKIPKEGHNPHFHYDYVKEDTLTEQIRPLLAKHGLALMFGAEVLPDPGDGRTRVLAHFTLIDVDGNELSSSCPGEGKDLKHQDKALPKALTGAVKYWLYKTFLVSTGDDQEQDGKETIDPPKDEMQQSQIDELSMYRKMEERDPGTFTEQLNTLLVRTLDEADSKTTATASQGTAKRLIEEARKQLKNRKVEKVEEATPDEEPPESEEVPL